MPGPKPLPDTSYAILGMLSLVPQSGYEVAANVGKTIAHFWTISKSQVYTELARLEERGLVSGTDVAQERAPDKRTYQLTAEGEAALDGWLAKPGFEQTRMRSTFLLKVFFAHRMPPEVLDEMLARHRSEAEQDRTVLQEVVDNLADFPEAHFTRISALYGVHNARATISWVDEVRAIGTPRREHAVEQDVIDTAAREQLDKAQRKPGRRS